MGKKSIDITILCKVVDNFGDIGVTWRLARKLQKISHFDKGTPTDNSNVCLRFVCDDLQSFSKINNQIDAEKSFQEYGGVKIYDWNNYDFCYNEFVKNPPEIILECFQCGRPDWLEKILFDDQKNELPEEQGIWSDGNRIVNIIMIDYLSAEKYQEDFHCLKSLTRSAKVQKVNFMPGFTNKTGGLLLPSNHLSGHLSEQTSYSGKFTADKTNLLNKHQLSQKATRPQQVLFFAYHNDWSPVVRAMNRVFTQDTTVFIAAGQGQKSILEACKNCDVKFHIKTLDFTNQEDWDKLMWNCDLLFVRGEDSLAQACLRGIPFIWQAYPQSEEYQTVKVKALLERMKTHFGDEFCFVENAWMAINENTTSNNTQSESVPSPTNILTNVSEKSIPDAIESAIHDFFSHADSLRKGFESFANSLYENNDLAHNLMTFIEKNIIIPA